MTTGVELKDLNIIFTNTSTTISDAGPPDTGPYLQIQLLTSASKQNFKHLQFKYYNPEATPSRLSEFIDDSTVFRSLALAIDGSGESLVERTSSYMNTLQPDEIAMIIQEYENNVPDGTILDGFSAGIGAYLTLFLLLENNIFPAQLPFEFSVPTTIASGNCLNRNMIQYMSLPLDALSNTCSGVIKQLIDFIYTFVNLWDAAFTLGPTISSTSITRMCMDLISGMSHHTVQQTGDVLRQHQTLLDGMNSIERNLNDKVDTTLCRIRREVHNLTISARQIHRYPDEYKLPNYPDSTCADSTCSDSTCADSTCADSTCSDSTCSSDRCHGSIEDIIDRKLAPICDRLTRIERRLTALEQSNGPSMYCDGNMPCPGGLMIQPAPRSNLNSLAPRPTNRRRIQ